MAAIEEALPQWLLDVAAVNSLIADRMFPEVLDQPGGGYATMPAVTFEVISTDETNKLAGRSGLCKSRFQFVAYGNTRKQANSVFRAIRNSGVDLLHGDVNGVDIRGVSIEEGFRTDRELIGEGEQDAATQSSTAQQYRYLTEFDLMVSYLEQTKWQIQETARRLPDQG